MNNMGLLQRLNLFRRVQDLENEEVKLLSSIDVLNDKLRQIEEVHEELEQGIEYMLEFMDKRVVLLRGLNVKLHSIEAERESSLDVLADLDIEENKHAA